MKKDIHPKFYENAKVTCVCGNEFTTGATQEEIKVEICSLCHPYFTGKQKLVDTARRVEKFQAKVALSAKTPAGKGKKAKQAEKQAAKAAKNSEK